MGIAIRVRSEPHQISCDTLMLNSLVKMHPKGLELHRDSFMSNVFIPHLESASRNHIRGAVKESSKIDWMSHQVQERRAMIEFHQKIDVAFRALFG